jgi:hypothetical protein
MQNCKFSVGLVILAYSLTACTPHEYRHRIETTYQGHRYIYYCDTVQQDKQGLFYKNSNGSIVRIQQ